MRAGEPRQCGIIRGSGKHAYPCPHIVEKTTLDSDGYLLAKIVGDCVVHSPWGWGGKPYESTHDHDFRQLIKGLPTHHDDASKEGKIRNRMNGAVRALSKTRARSGVLRDARRVRIIEKKIPHIKKLIIRLRKALKYGDARPTN